uniref:Uncharacterized protein n=1 Tax=Anguilla anguilla TaxID=7936 RepID=A0A0E9QCI1_ANGAN
MCAQTPESNVMIKNRMYTGNKECFCGFTMCSPLL